MKYLKGYRDLNEGLRHKMVGKSDEEILKKINPFKLNEYLAKFASYGYLNGVKKVLDMGADIHYNDNHALRAASNKGHYDIVEFLLDNGADIHVSDGEVLKLASLNGHYDVTKMLLDRGANPNTVKINTPLRLASFGGHVDIIKLLIEYGAKFDESYFEALSLAVQNNNEGVVEYLLEIGHKPTYNYDNLIIKSTNKGEHGIANLLKKYSVVFEGLRDKMRGKPEEEIDKKILDFPPDKILAYSTKFRYPKGIEIALERGADIHKHDDQYLVYAVERNYDEIVEILLKNGANPGVNNNQSLKYASRRGYNKIVELLIQYGADVKKSEGADLYWAVENGHIDTVKILLENGANPNDKDVMKRAVLLDRDKIIDLLLEYGVDPDIIYED